jgi:cytochrome c biogenesis factor
LWGGKRSLLFWTFILNLFSTIVHVQNRTKHRELMPYVTATLMTTLFFLGLLCFVTHHLSGSLLLRKKARI